MDKESTILEAMHRLGLDKVENGLLTFAVLEKVWDTAYEEAIEVMEQQGVPHSLEN